MAGRPQFSNTVEVAGGAVIGLNALYGTLTIGAIAQNIFIGTEPLAYRTGLVLQADPNNTDVIYIGLDDEVDSENAVIVLQSGNAFAIDLDSDAIVPVYAVSLSEGQLLHVVEVKK
jgi:hypothetical protein